MIITLQNHTGKVGTCTIPDDHWNNPGHSAAARVLMIHDVARSLTEGKPFTILASAQARNEWVRGENTPPATAPQTTPQKIAHIVAELLKLPPADRTIERAEEFARVVDFDHYGAESVGEQGRTLHYLNTGDSYGETVCIENGEPFAGSWAGWVEDQEASEAEDGNTRCGYCGEFTPTHPENWRQTRCEHCGRNVSTGEPMPEPSDDDDTDTDADDEPDPIKSRLEYLRGELRAGTLSYGEVHELEGLAPHIAPDDVELLEAAGVPENLAYDSESDPATAARRADKLRDAAPDMLALLQVILKRMDLEPVDSVFPCSAMRGDIRAIIARVMD